MVSGEIDHVTMVSPRIPLPVTLQKFQALQGQNDTFSVCEKRCKFCISFGHQQEAL